jgi:hypothetical protein
VRALAEFIMRGRAQAAAVALLGTFVPLISSSAVALVTLRRGGYDGFFVIGWAMLPIIVMTVVNPESLPMAFYSLSVLVAAIGGALVLRSQAIWSVAVMGIVVLSATGGLVFGTTFPNAIAELTEQINQTQAEALAQMEQGAEAAETIGVTPALIAGAMALLVGFNALLALVIGRWWQAILYNPGGFRQEFHEFRLSRTQALISFGAAAICISRANWVFWGVLAALPLLVACAAVVHNRVYAKRLGVQWLVLFYLLLLFSFQPVFWVALAIGFTDSWVDYRRRIGPQKAADKQ